MLKSQKNNKILWSFFWVYYYLIVMIRFENNAKLLLRTIICLRFLENIDFPLFDSYPYTLEKLSGMRDISENNIHKGWQLYA